MTELLTAAQMRAIEQAAIASGEVTGLELMERAGRGVVEAIFEEWPELKATSHRAVVLCGPGGNGGDGFVVARLLKEWGWEVEVFLHGDPERMPPDARVNYERWRGMGEVRPFLEAETSINRWFPNDPPVIVDALFGAGLTRELADEVKRLFWISNSHGSDARKKVAIDLPSGVCSDSGRVIAKPGPCGAPEIDGQVFSADITVTFAKAKHGHALAEGPLLEGKLRIKDIGVNKDRFLQWELTGDWTEVVDDLSGWDGDRLHRLSKWSEDHKYSHGHALILSGPSGRGGAARLAARGALRIGAGVVTVGCPLDAIPENAARLDAVMLRGVADGAALAGVLEDQRINALCLGPGLGLDARAVGLVSAALGVAFPALTRDLAPPGALDPYQGLGSGPGRSEGMSENAASPPTPSLPHEGGGGRLQTDGESGDAAGQPALPLPLVGRGEGRGASSHAERRKVALDADALTILSRHPDLFAALHQGCVLTPHAGEFARLFPDIAEKLAAPATKGPAYSKVDATREAAKRAGCVVLYKGPDTVIADPSGRCAINSAHYDRAAPWLATAGSGDVLAGFITGLLARGFAPFDAACTGAWLHVECALSFGPGLIAEDLPEELPKVFRALGL